jgi:hypothetical protein
MTDKLRLTPETPRRRPGRPSKADEVRQALAETGCDPALIDPKRILAAIAADPDAPAGARVAACKALLHLDPAAEGPAAEAETISKLLNARTLQILHRAN